MSPNKLWFLLLLLALIMLCFAAALLYRCKSKDIERAPITPMEELDDKIETNEEHGMFVLKNEEMELKQ